MSIYYLNLSSYNWSWLYFLFISISGLFYRIRIDTIKTCLMSNQCSVWQKSYNHFQLKLKNDHPCKEYIKDLFDDYCVEYHFLFLFINAFNIQYINNQYLELYQLVQFWYYRQFGQL